jgi:hypothetical protein
VENFSNKLMIIYINVRKNKWIEIQNGHQCKYLVRMMPPIKTLWDSIKWLSIY